MRQNIYKYAQLQWSARPVDGRRPLETSLTNRCVTVRFTTNLSRSERCMTNRSAACLTRAVLSCPVAPKLISHTCCVTDRSEANQCFLFLKVLGIPTPLTTLDFTLRYLLYPYQTEVDHLSEAVRGCQRRYQYSLCRTSLPGRYQHSRYLSRETDKSYRLFRT